MTDKTVLLIIGGGIAAYKSLELIRLIKKAGMRVRTIITKAGTEFVTPLSVAALSGEKALTDLFDLTDELEIGHIRLAREADLIVVAPATADLMAKMANGLANDLASTCLLAADGPVLLAPAMNPVMWQAPSTQRNLVQLRQDGIGFIGPDKGDMACGEEGEGRMVEPAVLFDEIEHLLSVETGQALAGRHVVVTSGPTHEPIDPVRYIANRSSGKQGYAIAQAAVNAGARVTLISGPVTLAPPAGVDLVAVETAEQMLAAVQAALPAECFIAAAAVADWRLARETGQKIKKTSGQLPPPLELTENPDILKTIATQVARRPDLVVGFAAETENLIENATAKRAAKGCDWIVANDVAPGSGTFGGDQNTVHLLTSDGLESWPRLSKQEVAQRLVERIARALGE
jgi:phosphopantothenoylcysteine decarboxylase/phosphopantothenate--cysteine ligase